MGLCAITIALAIDSPGTDGNLRLDDIVASACWIPVRIKESQYAVLLVRLG